MAIQRSTDSNQIMQTVFITNIKFVLLYPCETYKFYRNPHITSCFTLMLMKNSENVDLISLKMKISEYRQNKDPSKRKEMTIDQSYSVTVG